MSLATSGEESRDETRQLEGRGRMIRTVAYAPGSFSRPGVLEGRVDSATAKSAISRPSPPWCARSVPTGENLPVVSLLTSKTV
jgi:hypothetical protein